jgi:hypothetical protein
MRDAQARGNALHPYIFPRASELLLIPPRCTQPTRIIYTSKPRIMSTFPSNSANGPIDGTGEQLNPPMSSITNEVIPGPNNDSPKKKGKWLGWRAFKAQKAAQAKTPQQIEAAKEQRERQLQETKEKKMRDQKARLELQRVERARKIEREADGASLVYSANELRPYRRYTHLYGERLFQKPVVSILYTCISPDTHKPVGKASEHPLPSSASRDPSAHLQPRPLSQRPNRALARDRKRRCRL